MIDVVALLASLRIQIAKRAGKRLWAKCPDPDHDDKDPSWFIWNDPGAAGRKHGAHRCYGCGFRGGPLGLIAACLGVGTREAREWLQAGGHDDPVLAAEIEVGEARIPGQRLGAVFPAGVVFPGWGEWPTLARRYLERRGLGEEAVRRWGLGVAPRGVLAGRIVLPVRDLTGRVSTWQARTYVDDSIRYMTPTRGEVGGVFGAWHWPEPEDRDRVVVVEGPFDALAVDRAVRLPVAALLGSQMIPRQLASLATFREVVVATDADKAGEAAAAMIAGLSRWTRTRRVALPPGHDPASAGDAVIRGWF